MEKTVINLHIDSLIEKFEVNAKDLSSDAVRKIKYAVQSEIYKATQGAIEIANEQLKTIKKSHTKDYSQIIPMLEKLKSNIDYAIHLINRDTEGWEISNTIQEDIYELSNDIFSSFLG
ncbi:MAG: hypothetical protein KBA33_11015 [Cloacibacterium sp.]|nr:hypothetical protein [Cloacibacterium sp.]